MKVSFKPIFIRQYNKLHPAFQEEVLEKINLSPPQGVRYSPLGRGNGVGLLGKESAPPTLLHDSPSPPRGKPRGIRSRSLIELLKDKGNHKHLKVHNLHGRLAGRYSFSVNYKTRIVFAYLSKQEIALLAIGDHEVYDK